MRDEAVAPTRPVQRHLTPVHLDTNSRRSVQNGREQHKSHRADTIRRASTIRGIALPAEKS